MALLPSRPLDLSCAAGTAEKVAEVEAALRDGSLKVFDVNTFTVNGETVTSAPCDMTIMDWATGTVSYQGETYEAIVDGAFEESTFRSAPYFTLRIDGIVQARAVICNSCIEALNEERSHTLPFSLFIYFEGVNGTLCKMPLNCAILPRHSAALSPTAISP